MELIIDRATTRQSILNYLNTIKNEPNFKDLEREIWVKWARHLRPTRLATLLQLLIVAAEAQETITYGEALRILRKGSHNELNHLVRFIGMLCQEVGWPPLAVLLKKQDTQKVGAGFFKDYPVPNVANPSQSDMDLYEKYCEQQCFKNVPDQIEVCVRLSVFIGSGVMNPRLPN